MRLPLMFYQAIFWLLFPVWYFFGVWSNYEHRKEWEKKVCVCNHFYKNHRQEWYEGIKGYNCFKCECPDFELKKEIEK